MPYWLLLVTCTHILFLLTLNSDRVTIRCLFSCNFLYLFSSCRYGNQCKFLHDDQRQKPNNASQEQVKPNPFGFGTRSQSQFSNTNQPKQQQKPNPFGFGVQTGSTSNTAFSSTNQSHSQTVCFFPLEKDISLSN